jgi:hypothetical protein
VYRHQYFDLCLHDDDELAGLVSDGLAERTTLHEWPLSCVQRVTTSDGRQHIYKAQSGPSVEPEFYACARSSLLVGARTVYSHGGYSCMLLDPAEGTIVRDQHLRETEITKIGRLVMAQIASIEGTLPAYLDVGSEERWVALVSELARSLRTMCSRGYLRHMTPGQVDALERSALGPSTLEAFRDTRYAHGDLTATNLFVRPDGFHLIDWQFPKIAPRDLDLATLLESLDVDPLDHVDAGTVLAMWVLRIHWFAECATRWFPAGMASYDVQIARLASLIAEASLRTGRQRAGA